jgi:hypothetical protein
MSLMVSSATFLATRYGVNERTVRDIWKQRTWNNATRLLAEGTSPMPKKKLGRPMGSKDIRPRKQKLALKHMYSVDSPVPFNSSKRNAEPQFHALRMNTEYHDTISEQIQQETMSQQPLCGFLPLESSTKMVFLGDRPTIENERDAEVPSIDDQLHAWAQCQSRWIIDAALPIDEENPSARAPSVR